MWHVDFVNISAITWNKLTCMFGWNGKVSSNCIALIFHMHPQHLWNKKNQPKNVSKINRKKQFPQRKVLFPLKRNLTLETTVYWIQTKRLQRSQDPGEWKHVHPRRQRQRFTATSDHQPDQRSAFCPIPFPLCGFFFVLITPDCAWEDKGQRSRVIRRFFILVGVFCFLIVKAPNALTISIRQTKQFIGLSQWLK